MTATMNEILEANGLFVRWMIETDFSALVCYQQPPYLFTISMTKQNDTLGIFRMLKQSVECQFIFRFERNQRQILVTG